MADRLFGKPFGRMLSDVLQKHEKNKLDSIRKISQLDELQNRLEQLIQDAIVTPIHLKTNLKGRKNARTESVPASRLPCNAGMGDRWSGLEEPYFPIPVITISIPFEGDAFLFQCHPDNIRISGTPLGSVVGNTIEFDVYLWGKSGRGEDDMAAIFRNEKSILDFLQDINRQIEIFNNQLPPKIEKVFNEKFHELANQNAALDAMGIPEIKQEVVFQKQMEKKKDTKIVIQKIIIEKLSQINYNAGDVNMTIMEK